MAASIAGVVWQVVRLVRECRRDAASSAMAAAPVVMLARRVAIPQLTSNATRRVVGQWGGAGGASCEDHFALAGSVRVARRRVSVRNPFCCFCFFPAPRAQLFEGRSVRYLSKEINGTRAGDRKM